MATRVKNIEELLYYDKCQDLECMRWRLLAECCRLHRNFETALNGLNLIRHMLSMKDDVVKVFMENDYEYPMEKK